MKKFKFGFTLAEIAMSMGIVGIVAALVIPLATKNFYKQYHAMILSRTVAQIEKGNQNLIQQANDYISTQDNFSQISTLDSVSFSNLGCSLNCNFIQWFHSTTGTSSSNGTCAKNVIMSNWDLSSYQMMYNVWNGSTSGGEVFGYKIKNYDGTENAFDTNKVTKVTGSSSISVGRFNASDVTFVVAKQSNYSMTGQENADSGLLIYIDINGYTKKPNRAGYDIFAFKLLTNGKLLPASGIGSPAGDYAKKVVDAGYKITY